jgi:asparagine synthase (glutamine-hydrolysing)
MCGVIGYVGRSVPVGAAGLAAGCADLAHRGPDSQSTFTTHGLGLGATRLAVSGPMNLVPIAPVGPRGRTLAYNGELYGRPQSHPQGDTGWLAEHLSGSGSLPPAVDGMYAVACADLAQATVTLARDPIGIKPLFFARSRSGTSFASELTPLARWHALRASSSPGQTLQVLGLGGTLDGSTLLEGVEPVPPGGKVTLSGGRCEVAAPLLPQREDGATARERHDLEERIAASVERAAQHDGPIGLFLSSGVDSRVVAHSLAAANLPNVRVFSLDLEGERPPDLATLRLPGAAWRSWTHEVRTVGDQTFWGAYDEVLQTTSQPVFPASNAFVLLLAEMAANAGVRVCLTGEGVDELYGGYESYLSHCAEERDPISFYVEKRSFRIAADLLHDSTAAVEEVRLGLRDVVGDRASGLRGLFASEEALSLRPLLARLDHSTMRRAVEARVPFLHNGIPDAARGRSDWSLHGPYGAGKPLFRAAAAALGDESTAVAPKRPLRAGLATRITTERRMGVASELRDAGTQARLALRPRQANELAHRVAARSTDPAELLVALRVEQLATYFRRLTHHG